VCDNDLPGNSALQEVSRCYGKPMKGVRFDPRWKHSWDMADPMPDVLYAGERYIGPSLGELMVPATWATEALHTGESGRPSIVIKRDFAEEWQHSVVPEAYAHRDWPSQVYGRDEFNNVVRPFSGVNDTASLLKTFGATKGVELKYEPPAPSGIYNKNGTRCLNTHVPSRIKAESGDVEVFTEYMERMIPGERDRWELIRWLATLVARPDVKMSYGVLLISENQGVGKSTLGEKILAPLLGFDNVSFPTESEIVDNDFNYWAAHKRLAVVHEIYAGHSAKAYNKMKSLVTDDKIVINKKYQAAYTIDNWLHILACSNSMNALKVSFDDRRWFIPRVTEVRPNATYWKRLNDWLSLEGGLGKIAHYLGELGQRTDVAVMRGETAPDSEAKRDVVEEGFSPAMRFASEILNEIKEMHGEGYFYLTDLELRASIIRNFYQGREPDRMEKPLTFRKVAKAVGLHIRTDKLLARVWGDQPAWRARVISNDPMVDEYSWSTISRKVPENIDNVANRLRSFG
jgi:hypothetical protein